MENMSMCEKIKFLRKQEGLTLEEVGKAVGVGKSTVRKWENGDIKNMRRDKIASLASALHTTPAYLMGWEEQKEKPSLAEELTDEEYEMLRLWRAAPSDKRRRLALEILKED